MSGKRRILFINWMLGGWRRHRGFSGAGITTSWVQGSHEQSTLDEPDALIDALEGAQMSRPSGVSAEQLNWPNFTARFWSMGQYLRVQNKQIELLNSLIISLKFNHFI
jgi:hypothetical protein